MKYCMLATATVTDTRWTEEYTTEVTKLVASFGGKYIVRSSNIDCIEGDSSKPQVVVVMQFPSKEAFDEFYSSEAYRPFLSARQAGSVGKMYGMPWIDEVVDQ